MAWENCLGHFIGVSKMVLVYDNRRLSSAFDLIYVYHGVFGLASII